MRSSRLWMRSSKYSKTDKLKTKRPVSHIYILSFTLLKFLFEADLLFLSTSFSFEKNKFFQIFVSFVVENLQTMRKGPFADEVLFILLITRRFTGLWRSIEPLFLQNEIL